MGTDGGTEETGFTDDKPDATSLGQVNDRLDRIEQALARLIPGARAASEHKVEERLDRPSTVEEQVQAELARRDKAEAEKQAAGEAKKEQDDLKAKVAALAEKPPVPPLRRATKLLTAGWGDGR
jgi:hypothetical protein